MSLRKSTNKKTGRTRLAIAESCCVGKTCRTKGIRDSGYLDIPEKNYDNLIAYFTEPAGTKKPELTGCPLPKSTFP